MKLKNNTPTSWCTFCTYYKVNHNNGLWHCTESRCRNNELRRLYGINVGLYRGILEDQGGRCWICKSGEDLCIDHDHSTGVVRGLLCRRCNLGLGQFQDSIVLLSKAIHYLERSLDDECYY